MNKEQATQLVGFAERFSKANPLYTISSEFTLMPYNYGEEISNFIDFCYDNKLVNPDCYSIEEELVTNQIETEWYANLSEEKVIKCLGYFIRRDRFSDGLIASVIKDGTIPRLLDRIKVLHDL